MAQNIVELILSARDGITKVARDASINFTASASQMEKKAKEVDFSIAGMSDSISKAVKDIPGFSMAVSLITNPAVLAGAAIAGIGVAINGCIDKAKEFNDAFTPIKQLNLGKSAQEMKAYKDLVQDSAFATGANLKQAASGFYDVQSATGLFGEQAKAVFDPVAKFSWAVGAQLPESLNATTRAMKAFGFGVAEVESYLISNAKTVQTEYLGAAKGAGVTLNDANKVFSAFTSISKDSAQAATMTKTVFQGHH